MNQLFLEIMNVQSSTYHTERMAEYIFDYALSKGWDIDVDNDNLYVTKGVSPDGYYPCIVSHTDTVHDIIPDADYNVICDGNIAMAYDLRRMQPTGIGGDDKVGIYICLSMLDSLPYCKAAFFRDEEVGCVGSGLALMSFFKDCRFILQCDRKGNKDFVYSIMGSLLYSDKFYKAINPIISNYGYEESIGGLTDVYTLADKGVGISVANMSCGYWNPHMPDEMINLQDVENCLNMVYDIMLNCTDVYHHVVDKPVYNYYNNSSYNSKYNKSDKGDWYASDWPIYKSDKGKTFHDDNKWEGWDYNAGKWTKTLDKNMDECWSCYSEVHKDDLSAYGLCAHCHDWHYGDNVNISKSVS
jgi:tripeptide aminopeptidase